MEEAQLFTAIVPVIVGVVTAPISSVITWLLARKKYRAEGIRFPDFILQSYSNPNSLVLAQRQTYRSME